MPLYIGWLQEGYVVANQRLKILLQNEVLLLVDGQNGFGQVIAEEAMKLGIEQSEKYGAAVVAVRNSGHMGRIGDWAEMAARAGKISLHFVNTSGRGLLMAPFGGINRRLSANPMAAGIPVEGRDPIILDISCSAIAEGKVKVAYNKGVSVPDNCLIDSQGRATNDPRDLYDTPPGAILPFGGHKGYALGVVVEILAGALTGGSCSKPDVKRLEQAMLAIILDPRRFLAEDAFSHDVVQFLDFIKSSKTITPDGEILLPGQFEARNRAQRTQDGIDLDEKTWAQITEVCGSLGITQDNIDQLLSKG